VKEEQEEVAMCLSPAVRSVGHSFEPVWNNSWVQLQEIIKQTVLKGYDIITLRKQNVLGPLMGMPEHTHLIQVFTSPNNVH